MLPTQSAVFANCARTTGTGGNSSSARGYDSRGDQAKFFDFLLDLNLGPKGARHEEQRSASKKSDLRIEFLSSRPMAVIEGRVPANLMPRLLPFYPPHEKSAVRAEADRRTAITHRTILAIAEMIRG